MCLSVCLSVCPRLFLRCRVRSSIKTIQTATVRHLLNGDFAKTMPFEIVKLALSLTTLRDPTHQLCVYYTDSTARPHPLGPTSLPNRVLGQQPRRGSTNGNCSGGGGSVRHGVVGFIRGRWVHCCSPWGLWVHPGSLASLGFIRGRWVRWGLPWGS